MSTAASPSSSSSFPKPFIIPFSRLRRLRNPPPSPRCDLCRNSGFAIRTFSTPRRHGQTQEWHAPTAQSQGEEAQGRDQRHRSSSSEHCNVTYHVLPSNSFQCFLVCIFTSYYFRSLVAHVFFTSQPVVFHFVLRLSFLLFPSFSSPTDQSLPSPSCCRWDRDFVNHKLF